jgi:hypothetical protein
MGRLTRDKNELGIGLWGEMFDKAPFSTAWSKTPVVSYAPDTGILVAARGRNDVNRKFRKRIEQDLA